MEEMQEMQRNDFRPRSVQGRAGQPGVYVFSILPPFKSEEAVGPGYYLRDI